MGRFYSEFNRDVQKFTATKSKAPRSAAKKLAAAVVFGIERLEDRSLFSVVANPGGPYTLNEGSSITLNGTGSSDTSGGTITHYEWDLNYKGTFVLQASGATLNYSAVARPAGVTTIALEVVDSNNVTSSVATTTVTTNWVAPTITVTGGGAVNRGDTVPINWTYTSPDAESTTWNVNWGDGTTSDALSTSARTDSHVYAEDGNFTITVTSEQTVANNVQTSTGTTSVSVSPVLPVITLTGNAHVNELGTYSLGLSATDPSGIDTWAIDWGDGSNSDVLPGTATGATHAYATHGSYTITATAIDAAGDSSQATQAVIADDVAPVPTISGEPQSTINEGDTVSLTAAPGDPGSATSAYAWTVTKDGQPFTLPNGTVTNASTLSFVAGYSGSYVASVVVTDDASETGTASSTAIIANPVAPTVTIPTGYSTSINKGDTVTLSASPSDPGTDDNYVYAWSVELNGSQYALPEDVATAGSSFSFVAGRSGTFVATVVVTDRDGGTGTASSQTITAAAVAPTATISGEPGPINEGTAFTLTATPSDVGVDESYTYAWTLAKTVNNVTTTVNLPSPVVTDAATFGYTPEDEGTYVATCVVTDSDGSTVSTSSQNIVVSDVAPTVAFTGVPVSTVNEGSSVTLTATPTEASTDRTYSYLWSVSRTYNGNTTSVSLANGSNTSSTLSFTPPSEGTYVATAVVTDDEGGSTTQASGNITVATVPATVAITGDTPTEINEGTAVNLSASSTEPGSGHSYSYSWSVTKNGSAYTLPGSGDIAHGGVASASSDYSNGYVPAYGFDGNTSTQWFTSAGSRTGYLQYDLGSANAAVVSSYGIYPNTFSPNYSPTTWTFLGSNNATNWTTLDSRTSHTLTPAQSNVFSFSNSTAYRYYRLNVTQNAGNAPMGIADLSLIGTGTTSPTLAFTPTTEGNYVATVTATDEDGNVVSQNSNTITVNNVPPTVTVSGTPNASIAEGTAVALTSTATEPGPGGYTYAWSVTNNGNAVTLPNSVATNTSSLNFTPVAQGTYVATLVVTDSEGGQTSTASSNITVTAAAPTASVTGIPQSSVNEYSPLTLGVSASDVNPANTRTYSWSVTQNGQTYSLPAPINTTGTSFTFTPNDAGTYVVSCLVTNSEGQSTTATSGNITVAAIPPTASITLADGTRAEGTAISASAVTGDVGASDTVTYAWSVQRDGSAYTLPNGTNTTGSSFTFTPGDEGSYQIFLTATDSGGSTNASTSAIAVADVAPGVTITGAPGGNASEGSAITLGTTVTQTGANDSVASYAWTVTCNGQTFDLGNATTNADSLTFTPVNAGTYVATVTVTNASDGNIAGGQTQVSTAALNVVNVPPTVVVTGTTGPVTNGAALSFSAAASEPGSNTLSYAWTVTRNGHAITLGSGVNTTSPTLSFSAGRAGSFIATCTVTDSEGGVGSDASSSVTVTDVAPTVTIGGEPQGSVGAGTVIVLNADATDPGALEHFNYAWSVTRDGSAYTLPVNDSTSGATLDFTPDRLGNYVASVTVTDTDGGATSVNSTTIAVTDVAPTVTITGPLTAVNEGQTLTFTSTATNPTSGDTFTYAWNVDYNGNGFDLGSTPANASTLSFVAPEGGTYLATETVTDSAGSAGSSNSTATVNWVSPTVAITGAPSQSVNAGSAINLTATPSEAGSGHTFAYAWSVTRNGVAYTLPNSVVTDTSGFSFNPGRAGTFVATCTVTDEDSQTATESTSAITALDVLPTVGISGAPQGVQAEGTTLSLTAFATSPGADETFTYQWSVTKDGSAYTLPNSVATNTSSLDFVAGLAGEYTATVTVTDLDGGVTTQSTSAMAINATPITVTVSGQPQSAVNAGTTLNLSAGATNTGPAEQFSYTWSVLLNGQPYTLPQGTATNASSLSFTTTDPGFYNATCLVADTSDQTSSGNTGNIQVNAVPPTVSITGAPSSGINEGTAVALTAVAADADSNDFYSYAWSVTKNGSAFTLPQGTVTNTAAFAFTPNDPGTFVATVHVTDKENLTASSTATITSDDVAPVVTISGAPQAPIRVGTPLSFNGSTTSVGTSDAVSSLAWTVTKNGSAYTPQGNPATNGTAFNFTPDGEGTYLVTLTATNNHGTVGTASTSDILVRPVAPNVNVSGTTGTIDEGGSVSVIAAATDPSTADTYSYAWTVTLNGAPYTLPNSVATNAATLNFTAEQVGTYVANVTVTDADSLTATGSSSSILAADVAPTVAITGEPSGAISENSTAVSLTATPTEPGSGQTYTYAWSVTKGGSPFTLPNSVATNAATLTFTPPRTGSYIASVEVTDADGGTGSSSSTAIAVSAVDPTVVVSGEPQGPVGEGTPLALTATASDPGVGDTFSYAWAITLDGSAYTPASGTTLNNSALNFTPGQPGGYVATCTVTDADGAVGSQASSSMTVRAVPPQVTISAAPTSSPEGTAINLTATATSPRTNDTFSYAWAITLNGSAYTPATGTVLNAATLNFTPGQPGAYIATCTVTDEDSATASQSASSIAVTTVSPVVSITAAPSTVAEGTAVSLTASATSPRTNDTFSYAWAITLNGSAYTPASGTVLNQAALNFTPGQPGAYIATCNVTDTDGAIGSQSSSSIAVTAVNPSVSITTAPTTVSEGTAVSLTASATSPRTADTFSYAWGITLNGQAYTPAAETTLNAATLNFTPGQPGAYIATCTVTDVDGAIGSQSASSIAVTAVNPVVTITGAPSTSPEGAALSLTASANSPRTNDTYTYAWAITLNGQSYTPVGSPALNSATLNFTPGQPGAYVATCTVTDTDGAVGSQSASFAVTQVNPVVTITTAPSTDPEGTAINLTASAASPRTSDTFSYAWAITLNGSAFSPGVGTQLTNAALTFTPSQPGTYIATCTVTDTDGAVGSASTTSIAVSTVQPVVIIGSAPTSVPEGTAISLTASATSPRTNDTFNYAWAITRNGSAYTPANGTALNTTSLNFTPGLPGTYVATCTVTDADGAIGTQSTSSISVTTVNPTVNITTPPSSVAEGTAVSVTASATSPRAADTYSYAWSITRNGQAYAPANGTVLNAAALNFTPGQPGSYIATCQVTDADGAVGSQSAAPIAVTTVNPVVSITSAPSSVAEGIAVGLTASATSPRTADTFSYAWTISLNGAPYTPTSGTQLNAATLNFVPGQPGSYVATCTVTDADGAVGTQHSTAITVTSVAPVVTISGAPGISVGEGTTLNLTAVPSSPRSADTYSYAWTVTRNGQPFTLGNAVVAIAPTLSFTPSTAGSYVATVTVTDVDHATSTASTSAITLVNVPPTVTIRNLPSGAISTGSSFSLAAHAVEPGNGVYTYAWTVNGSNVPISTSQTWNGIAQLAGTYNVLLTVTDAEGGVGTASAVITVNDVAPTAAITGAPSTIAEGTAITLGSTATDPGTQFGETFSYLWTVTRNGVSYPITNAAGSNVTFTPNEYGSYVTTLTVTDSQGTATAVTANTTVTDVAPTSALASVPTVLRGVPVSFAGSLTDAGTADGETVTWNFGDGTPTQTFASTAANALTPTHAYAAAGNYTATETVTDSGGLSSSSTQSVNVVGAELAADPFAAGKTALFVAGTTGNDSIKFYSEANGRVKVTLDGSNVGVFAPTGHIIAEGMGSGNDTISVAAAIKNPAVLYGNAGTDSLYGGGGTNILVAGTGNDSLYAGAGADILVGGNGKDVLTGGAGNDLLVGGSWPFATNQATLAAIDAQWTRTDESFASVVHQLRGVQAGSLAGSTLLSTSNVTNTSGEFLICGTGRDWLLPVNTDVVENFINSKDVESGGAVSAAHTRHRPA